MIPGISPIESFHHAQTSDYQWIVPGAGRGRRCRFGAPSGQESRWPNPARRNDGRPAQRAGRAHPRRRQVPCQRRPGRPWHRHQGRRPGGQLHRQAVQGSRSGTGGRQRNLLPEGSAGRSDDAARNHPVGRNSAADHEPQDAGRRHDLQPGPARGQGPRRWRGVRRLRHHRAGVWLGRLRGRRREGQGPADAGQRAALGRSQFLCRQGADLLRPLDLQVRAGGAHGSRRRDPDPQNRHGQLWLGCGAQLVVWRALGSGRRSRAEAGAGRLGATGKSARHAGRCRTGFGCADRWRRRRRDSARCRCRCRSTPTWSPPFATSSPAT